jgi:hypothetical protein
MKAYPRNLPVLLGIMLVLAAAYVLGPYLGSIKFAPPLQPWMTEERVAQGLDGEQIIDASVDPAGVIVVQKDAISSIRIRGEDRDSIHVEFNLDHLGHKYRVEGKFPWHDVGSVAEPQRFQFYHLDAVAKRADR